MIGILTAIIGDLASIFGCLIDLKKEVTAITFVALGTSLPDLFASKSAALNEKYADASIGNVTGSNSVNVFLGLGMSWVIASIYHAIKVDICFTSGIIYTNLIMPVIHIGGPTLSQLVIYSDSLISSITQGIVVLSQGHCSSFVFYS